MPDLPSFDLITMGRSSIDLYSNDIGTRFEEITSFAAYVGGSPTNIAVGGRRLGLRTALLTAVGDDKVGDFILHFLEDEGVDISFIPRKATARSSAVLLGIEKDRFPLVFYRDNAPDWQLGIDDVLGTPIERAGALEISGTGLAGSPQAAATMFAAERAAKAGVTVFMDLDFRADQWFDPRAYGVMVRSVLPNVDVAIGTEEEVNAAMLQDPKDLVVRDSQVSAPEIRGDLDTNVATLLEIPGGPEALVVKRGSKGTSVHLRSGVVLEVPGFPVEPVNVLGAGDAFAAGFIYGRMKGWDWHKASRMGNACGAIVVTRHACANSMAFEQEALDFVSEHGGF